VLGEYDKAREEVLEGQEITQDVNLQHTMNLIDTYLNKEQYDTLMEQAAECVLQENYIEGTKIYKQAIELLPGESTAYIELTKVLIAREEYDEALHILKDGVKYTDNIEINDLLDQVTELKQLKEDRNSLLLSLYNALKTRNFSDAATIMDTELFKENLAQGLPAYYNIVNNTPVYFTNGNDDILVGLKLIIYNDKSVYYGDIHNGKKQGNGIYFIRSKTGKKPGYYYYDGKWNRDLPNGRGKTVEESKLVDASGKAYIYRTVTEGIFFDALENGRMKKIFYKAGKETGRLTYQASYGVPLPLQLSSHDPDSTPGADSYIIGKLTSEDNPVGENYSIKASTEWGFLPLKTK
jgi:tetratricopeptide (TPR) repeat protein